MPGEKGPADKRPAEKDARRRDATATRAAILASARSAFIASGYEGAGVREIAEGAGRARNVVIEFSSLQAAHDCYHSPEYQAAKAIRQRHADGEIVLVEGV